VFPCAEIIVNEKELQFFRDPDSPSRAPPGEPQEFFAGMRFATAPYADRIRTVRDGPVMPGVTAVTQPGHTPGHTGWLVESGNDAVMIWGDILHMPNVQLSAPQAGTILDIDRDLAVATRRRALDMAATDKLRVAGIHFDFPAFGHIVRRADAYAFVPEVWRAVL
jgi:glyoxylase-like metal-dependent hydrolase (beta-lactamase superfamily II)